jgi:hypothetical protein
MFITKIWSHEFAFSLCSFWGKGNGVFELHMHMRTVIILHGIAFYVQVHYCSLFKISDCFPCTDRPTVIFVIFHHNQKRPSQEKHISFWGVLNILKLSLKLISTSIKETHCRRCGSVEMRIFQILTITLSWNATPYVLVDMYRRFKSTCRFRNQCRYRQ